jgi:mono/diheme cytochrome c family protein
MLATLLGCTGPEAPPVDDALDWSDVAPIVGRHCAGCHQPGGVAGLALVSYDQVAAARDVVDYAVFSGDMPPWPAAPGDYAFADDPTLSPDEIDTLRRWIADDAPLGDADPTLVATAPPLQPLPEVTSELRFPAPYTPAALADDYRCIPLVPTEPFGPYIRGFEVVVGNPAVVHHVKLVAVYPHDGGAVLAAEDAADPGPGFACSDDDDVDYGGPSVLFGGWLPGSSATVFPDDMGLKLQPDPRFLVVMHYHPTGATWASDDTEVRLWTAPTVARPVDPHRITDLAWRLPPDEGGMLIPAGATGVDYTVSETVRELPLTAFDPAPAGVDVLSVQLHMHRLGTHGSVQVVRGGTATFLLDVPQWDFDWQLAYWLVAPVHLDPDDQLILDCNYDNPGPVDVTWGEGSDDEMCAAMVNVVPPS